MIAFHGVPVESIIKISNIIMVVSLNKQVFVVEEVESFQELEAIKTSALSSQFRPQTLTHVSCSLGMRLLSSAKYCSFVLTPASLLLLVCLLLYSMDNKKAKCTPCKCVHENLDSLVHQHASSFGDGYLFYHILRPVHYLSTAETILVAPPTTIEAMKGTRV